MPLPKLGLQMIVFSGKFKDETDRVLDCVKDAGYAAIEGGGLDAPTLRRKLDERGMVLGGAHTSPARLVDPTDTIAYLKTMGCTELCNSGLMQWDKRSLADYLEAIKVLNRAGRQLADEGIRLHYHNHDFEFSKVDGDKTGFDILLDGLDLSVVDFCFDIAWLHVAGVEPVKFLAQHKDKTSYLHFKDHDGKTWTELGRGGVDWKGVMKVLPSMKNVRWVMVEQDSTKIDPCESCRISRKFLADEFGF